MAANVIDIIGTLIDKIRKTGTITSITHSGTVYTILTSNTEDLEVGDWVEISGTDYKITDITTDVNFKVTSTSAITGTTWKAKAPYYFYGTAIQISNTLDKIKDDQNKYPAVVLMETMPATVNNDVNSNIERTVSLDMFFVDKANYSDWTSEDYYTNVIELIQEYIDDFIEECSISTLVSLPDTHKETPHSKWNLVRLDTGKNVFNAQLSGIQLEIELGFYYIAECNE